MNNIYNSIALYSSVHLAPTSSLTFRGKPSRNGIYSLVKTWLLPNGSLKLILIIFYSFATAFL